MSKNKPTKKQLESIFFLYNDYTGKTNGEICQQIWDYVEREIKKSNQKTTTNK